LTINQIKNIPNEKAALIKLLFTVLEFSLVFIPLCCLIYRPTNMKMKIGPILIHKNSGLMEKSLKEPSKFKMEMIALIPSNHMIHITKPIPSPIRSSFFLTAMKLFSTFSPPIKEYGLGY